MSRKKTKDEFIADAIKIHGTKYNYSKTVYAGNKVKITITCPIHGDWEQRPNDHTSGYGCKECGHVLAGGKQKVTKKSKRFNDTEWKQYLLKHYPHLSFISKINIGEWDADDKITLKCNIHKNEFETTTATIKHKNKKLCPVCVKMNHILHKERRTKKHLNGSVYLLYIPAIKMYKMGFSTNVKNRAYGIGRKTELIWEHKMSFLEASELEHWIHNKYEKYRYFGDVKLLKHGNTELYESDILVDYKKITTAFYEETHSLKKLKTGNS